MAQELQPKKGQSELPSPAYIPLSGKDKHIAIVGEHEEKKKTNGSLDRDVALAEVGKGKRTSYIKAREENEKTKAVNKFKQSEESMLKVMKAKGAAAGNPMMGLTLRHEARKLIGDTGLIDHLLKHLAGREMLMELVKNEELGDQVMQISRSLKGMEQKLERKKAGYGETVKNKVASVHKQAEEKRATIQARRGEDLLKVEETSAKYRATDQVPKKTCGCF